MRSPFQGCPRLPVIDVSAVDLSPELRSHAAAQIDWALAEFGFFYVAGHGVDEGALARLFDLSREFFALDEATKASIRMPLAGVAWRGWFPVGEELTSGQPDVKEGIYFGEEHAPENPRVRAGVRIARSHSPSRISRKRRESIRSNSTAKDSWHSAARRRNPERCASSWSINITWPVPRQSAPPPARWPCRVRCS